MDAEKHLEEAEDCLRRTWERYGERNHIEIGVAASRTHTLLARLIRNGGRDYSLSRSLMEKAEDLLKPGKAEEAYGRGEMLNGMKVAESYALLAEEKLRSN